VPELIAKSAFAGHPPVSRAGTTLAEGHLGPITSVAPFQGQDKAVAKALTPLGLSFPAPNTVSATAAARLVWAGRGQAFLIGVAAPDALSDVAALTDQTDGWACLTLQGPQAVAALMRLVPLDLRTSAFPVGTCLRAGLNHMQAILIRTGEDAFEVLVFRSMARTAWHEVEAALVGLAARADLARADLA
jgi:heterotetrameric sarcosine oxidase gamma subunit